MESIECPEWQKLKNMFPEIDFSDEIENTEQLSEFLKQAIIQQTMRQQHPLEDSEAPKLNDDFSNYFVINNLPKCKQEKIPKLVTLIVKNLAKNNQIIEDTDVQVPINEETGETDGVAFVSMKNEEHARIGASIFNGYQLTKKNIFSSCLLPEFEKVMQTSEEFKMPEAAELMDLRAPVLDTRTENYMFMDQTKHVNAKNFNGASFFSRGQNSDDPSIIVEDEQNQLVSDKPANWSPKGTYLIIIKADKVVFLGGKAMTPIISIPQAKVHSVKMSPCERYVVTYSPMGNFGFTVWNFQMVEIIREFQQEREETEHTYVWSHTGDYLAKKFVKEIEAEEGDGEAKTKTGISVYELPSMQLQANTEGQKKSITIEAIVDFMWAPHKNLLVYTTFPEGTHVQPRIGFIDVDTRRTMKVHACSNSIQLDLYFHPQGNYLAVANAYKNKKLTRYSVEVFDTNNSSLPHQQIPINREVYDFRGVKWEPNHNKISIHTNSKKELEAGRREYALDPKRDGIDIYEMHHDKQLGFVVKTIGFLNADKVKDFYWSGTGDIFTISEREGTTMNVKTIYSFYMINEEEQKVTNLQHATKGGGKGITSRLVGQEKKFEFRKIARHEDPNTMSSAVWDFSGRFFAIIGEMKPFDREKLKSFRIFSMFGELLTLKEKVVMLSHFAFRPRPTGILTKNQLTKLRQTYRETYAKKLREEDRLEKASANKGISDSKKVVRDKFLNEFFMPLRQEYEKNIDQYIKLWPIKDEELVEEPTKVDHIYAFGEVLNITKLE